MSMSVKVDFLVLQKFRDRSILWVGLNALLHAATYTEVGELLDILATIIRVWTKGSSSFNRIHNGRSSLLFCPTNAHVYDT